MFMIGSVFADPIGDIIEHKGNATITREQGEQLSVSSQYIPEIQLNDTAETVNGRMLIEFLDKAQLSLIEHTKVFIDKVYYDPDPSKSAMTMKFVLGTARFASGRLGMVNKNNIDLQTPTAQIAVRGTDFTTTVDELGRTLVILLPDDDGNPSGVIDVFNEAGSVTLNEPYAATMVSSISSVPTQSVVIQNLTPAIIDNMFIVSPPQEIKNKIQEQVADDNNVDQGLLDVDFLEFNDLETDYLETDDLEYTELDVDLLDAEFLVDMLDIIEELVRTTERLADEQAGTGTVTLKNAAFGFNKDSQYNIFEEDGDIVFFRNVNGTIRLKLKSNASVKITTFVEGFEGDILLNSGSDSIIVITQQN